MKEPLDILSFSDISKLNDSEVATPQNIVSDMVDLLPADVFNPDAKFLDPSCTSGRFPAELKRRLMASPLMQEAIPDETERERHIIDSQIYAICHNEVSALITRKMLYGNCMVQKNVRFIENYYAIVVSKDTDYKKLIEKEFGVNMKFDVVIGNPPYNNDIYIDFVNFSYAVSNQHVCMITPAKWQGKSGKKNTDFREKIVPYISELIYYPDCSDIFAIGEVGGIAYYSIAKIRQAQLSVVEICLKNTVLNSHGTIKQIGTEALDIVGNSIIEKLGTFKKFSIKNLSLSYKHKIYTNNLAAIGGSKSQGSYLLSKDGKLQMLAKSTITHDKIDEAMFSGNFHITFSSNNAEECESAYSYMQTKLVRFLIFCGRCGNSLMTDAAWRFVPYPDKFDHVFTDRELYERYKLTVDEIKVVESIIKTRE